MSTAKPLPKSPPAPLPEPRRQLRNRLKSQAHAVLASVVAPLDQPETVDVCDRTYRCTLTVGPAGVPGPDAPTPERWGDDLNAFHRLIIVALRAENKPLSARAIARHVGLQPASSKLKYLLWDLRLRKWIRAEKTGYVLPPVALATPVH